MIKTGFNKIHKFVNSKERKAWYVRGEELAVGLIYATAKEMESNFTKYYDVEIEDISQPVYDVTVAEIYNTDTILIQYKGSEYHLNAAILAELEERCDLHGIDSSILKLVVYKNTPPKKHNGQEFGVKGFDINDYIKALDKNYEKFKDTPNFRFLDWALKEILFYLKNDISIENYHYDKMKAIMLNKRKYSAD